MLLKVVFLSRFPWAVDPLVGLKVKFRDGFRHVLRRGIWERLFIVKCLLDSVEKISILCVVPGGNFGIINLVFNGVLQPFFASRMEKLMRKM